MFSTTLHRAIFCSLVSYFNNMKNYFTIQARFIHTLSFLIFIIITFSASYSQAEWDKSLPASGDSLTTWPTQSQSNNSALDTILSLYPKGITLTYTSGSTITASTGGVACSNSGGTIRKMRSNSSTTAITFSDLDTGSEASSTYYVYANCDAAATTATFKISASSSSPTGVTSYERIGSFVNDSSSNITQINNDNVINEDGAWASKSVGVVYQATTDGTACATITTDGSGTSGYITGITDNSSSPSTVRGYASSIENSQADHSSTRNGFCMPVRAGDYYEVTQSTWAGASADGAATVYFLSTN